MKCLLQMKCPLYISWQYDITNIYLQWIHVWIYVIPNSAVYIWIKSTDFKVIRGRIPNRNTYNYTWDKNFICLYYSLILKGKIYFIMIMQVSAIYNSYILGNSDFPDSKNSAWLQLFLFYVYNCAFVSIIIILIFHQAVETRFSDF